MADRATFETNKAEMIDRHWYVLYVLVCLEVGIFLTLVPWSAIWERNYFLQVYPSLKPFLLDPSIRGAVSGLGVANIFVVLHEIVGRRRQSALSSTELFPGGFHLMADSQQENDSSESPTLATHEKRS